MLRARLGRMLRARLGRMLRARLGRMLRARLGKSCVRGSDGWQWQLADERQADG
jgi:hypothetical protein